MENKKNSIIEEYKANREVYIRLGESMNSLIDMLLHTSGIQIHTIQSRVKEEDSLADKIQLKNKYQKLSDITDIIGLRIITYYSSDTDRVEGVIKNEFKVDEKNTIDKRKRDDPERFGYMSLHYVVSLNEKRSNLIEYNQFKDIKFEIQIRTILQHTWAEIEHDLGYKSKNSVPLHIRRKFASLSGTLELVDGAFIDIKKALIEYDEEVKNQVKQQVTTNKKTQGKGSSNEDVSDINEILIKNFILSSAMMAGMYNEYISHDGINSDGHETYLYPNHAKNDDEVNYETCVNVLNRIKIKTLGELLNLTSSMAKDDLLIPTLLKFQPKYMIEKHLSKYFFFLFSLYIYVYKNGLTESFSDFGGYELIMKLGGIYDSLNKKEITD